MAVRIKREKEKYIKIFYMEKSIGFNWEDEETGWGELTPRFDSLCQDTFLHIGDLKY